MLAIAVVIIWGIIGYRIYQSLNPSAEPVVAKFEETSIEKLVPAKMDSFSLVELNSDPFLGTIYKPLVEPMPQNANNRRKIDWPQLSYVGHIKKQDSKNSLFVINIDNEQLLFKKGQTINGIALIDGNEKSIRLRFKGITQTFSITP